MERTRRPTDHHSVLEALARAAGEKPICPSLTASCHHATIRKGHGIAIRIWAPTSELSHAPRFQSILPPELGRDEVGTINASGPSDRMHISLITVCTARWHPLGGRWVCQPARVP